MKRIWLIVVGVLMAAAMGCSYIGGGEIASSGDSKISNMLQLCDDLDEEIISVADPDVLAAIRGSVYVWQKYGYHGLFQISFNSDYTYEYCVGGDDAEIICGNWEIDECRILTMYDYSSAEVVGNVNYFEVCPCIVEGEYKLEYCADISDGFFYIGDVEGDFYSLYEYSYTELDNVLGQPSIYAYYKGTMPLLGTYYLNDGDNSLEVWGTNPSDVVFIDLDNDEKTEMIASVIWDDGVEDVLVYRATDKSIAKAYGSSLLNEDYEIGYAWSVIAQYVIETNQIKITYIPAGENDYRDVYYDMDLDALKWELVCEY